MVFVRKRKIAAAKKKEDAERRKFMLRNGRFLLEEMISSFNGKSNPIRSFSAPVILKATNNFDEALAFSQGDDRCFRQADPLHSWRRGNLKEYHLYSWHKGIIEDLPVLVKSFRLSKFTNCQMEKITRDIAVSSQMSSHKNVLKLIGCCFEFRYPVLVFEYVAKLALNDHDCGLETGETLPWNIRLKIAKETASAVAYLHTTFPKRIVHRNIRPSQILLDEKWTAKLSDFSYSILIPDGESHVGADYRVSYGHDFDDPSYYINEKYDVFSFGIFLLVLITGKGSFYPCGTEGPTRLKELVADELIEILDPTLVEEEASELQQMQWKAFIKLAKECSRDKREDRPEMIEVAKELARIQKLTIPSDMNLDKQTEIVAAPTESSGDNSVARPVHRHHTFSHFLKEFQPLLCLMLIFYLLLQWNT